LGTIKKAVSCSYYVRQFFICKEINFLLTLYKLETL
jgi:hypothetical protein